MTGKKTKRHVHVDVSNRTRASIMEVISKEPRVGKSPIGRVINYRWRSIRNYAQAGTYFGLKNQRRCANTGERGALYVIALRGKKIRRRRGGEGRR